VQRTHVQNMSISEVGQYEDSVEPRIYYYL